MGQEPSNTGKCNNTSIDRYNKNGAHSVNPEKVISYALDHVHPRQKYLVFGYMRQFRSTMINFYNKTSIVKVFGFMYINQFETLSVLSNHNRQCFRNIRLLILLYFHDKKPEKEIVINDERKREIEHNRKESKVVEDLYDEIYDDLLLIVTAASRSPSPMPPPTETNINLESPKYGTNNNNNHHLLSPRTRLVNKYQQQLAMKIDNDKGFKLRHNEWWVSPEYSPEFPNPSQIEFQQS